MHGGFEKPGKSEHRISRETGIGFLVLPIMIAIVVVTLSILRPSPSNWIAEAVQAEFMGEGFVPPGQSPTELAQPVGEPHSSTSGWIVRVQTAWRGQR